MSEKNKRNWENKSVWTLNQLQTQPGQWNASMQELKAYWKKYIEAQMKNGDVLSYKMFVVHSRRYQEPDLMLMVEYKNWATFDRSPKHFEELMDQAFGSFDAAVDAKIDRQSLRLCRGEITLQEVGFIE